MKAKQVSMWMMRGPSGGPAPFYGCAFSKKTLLADIRVMRLAPDSNYKPMRVGVIVPELRERKRVSK